MRSRSNLNKFAEQNINIYILFMILFLTGLSIGAAIVNVVSIESCNLIVKPLKNVTGDITSDKAVDIIIKTFISSMKPVIFMWIAGFTNFSVYCIIICLVYKGGLLGFIIGVIFRIYGLESGLAISLSSILPQYLIYIPILFLMAGYSYKYTFDRKKSIGARNMIRYFLKLLMCSLGCILVAVTDAYITSFLIKTFVNGG